MTDETKKRLEEMEFGKYYAVEVSFRPTNPIHRAIAASVRKSEGQSVAKISCDLFSSGYKNVLKVNVYDLAYFRVVEEIKFMDKPFSNEHRLPENAKHFSEAFKNERWNKEAVG